MLDERIVNQFDQPTALRLAQVKASRGLVSSTPEVSKERKELRPSAQDFRPRPQKAVAPSPTDKEPGSESEQIDNIKLLKEEGKLQQYTFDGPLQQNSLFAVVRDAFGLNPEVGYMNEVLISEVGSMAIELAGTENPAEVFTFLQDKIKMVNTISDPLVQLIKLKRLLKIEQDQMANKFFHKQKQEKMKRIYLRESLGGE